MNAVQKFNGLKGIITEKELKEIAQAAKAEGQTHLANRCNAALKIAEAENIDHFETGSPAIDQVPENCLPGMEPLPDYILSCEDFTGLNKAVSPNDIYNYITELIINTIEKNGELPWQKSWSSTGLAKGDIAYNYISKSPYRGINFFLLNFKTVPIEKTDKYELKFVRYENPAFLTFKQIEKLGGKLKKGSTGSRVMYFTQLYQYEQVKPKLNYGTYDRKKFISWAEKNKSKIKDMNGKYPLTASKLADYYTIPILKYYNVFNAGAVEGIEFEKLDPNENAAKTEAQKIEVAEAIIKSFPNPPKIKYKGDQPAYYPITDEILHTPIEQFKTPQEFYSTLFHEMIHSTGHPKRLNRAFGKNHADPQYAKEELIAEMGAVFLCAESGILFHTLNNSAAYLKGWNKNLVKAMKNDNRLFFTASSRSQAAADYILHRDKNNVPAYRRLKPKKKPATKKPAKQAAALAGSWHEPGSIEAEALNECGRLNKGYYYGKGGKIMKAKNSGVGQGKKKSPNKIAEDPTAKKSGTRATPKKAVRSGKKNLPLTINYPIAQIEVPASKKVSAKEAAKLRENFNPQKMDPVTVRAISKNRAQLVSGQNILEAFKKENYDNVPVIFNKTNLRHRKKKQPANQLALLGDAGETTKQPNTNGAEKREFGEATPAPVSVKKRTLKASDIAAMDFKTLQISEGWENLFQDPAENMKIAIWAGPKNGKTAGSCKFASYLTKFGPVLYNFADQGINLSTKKLIQLSGLDKKANAYITTSNDLEDLLADIEETNAQYIFIDMINQYIDNGVTHFQFKKEVLQRYPEKSFILIFEVTKGGNFKGDQAWTHLVDQLVTIDHYIMDSKGRYGTGSMVIWEEGAKKYNPTRYAEIKETEPAAPKTAGLSNTNKKGGTSENEIAQMAYNFEPIG